MKNIYVVRMIGIGGVRRIEADYISVKDGHILFGKRGADLFLGIALSQILEWSVAPNPDHIQSGDNA